MQHSSAKNIIISGVHLELTEALKNIVTEKVEKLFRHHDGIIAVKVELIMDHHKKHQNEFIAKGHVEVEGPSIIATAASDNEYKSIDLLVHKLNRKLLERAHYFRTKRKTLQTIDLPAVLPKVIPV